VFQILTGLDDVGWSAVFCDDLLAFLLKETQPPYDLELELYFRGKALVGAATTKNGAQLPLSRGTILVQLEIVVRSLSTRNLHRTEFVRSLSAARQRPKKLPLFSSRCSGPSAMQAASKAPLRAPYSCRKAFMGSTRAARRAGMYAASTATAKTTSGTMK
jgi:hypothetical protein